MGRFAPMVVPTVDLQAPLVGQPGLAEGSDQSSINGLANGLAGVAAGARHASIVLAHLSEEQQIAAERQAQRDAYMRHAQMETALTRYETDTMQSVTDAAAYSVKQPPPLMESTFDAQVKELEKGLDQFKEAEDPRFYERARQALVTHTLSARNHVSTYAASRSAEDAVGAIAEQELSLEDQVASGVMQPEQAIATIHSSITAQTGVTIHSDRAVQIKEDVAGKILAGWIQPLLDRSETDPTVYAEARRRLNSPLAVKYLSPDGRRRQLDLLDSREEHAQEYFAKRAINGELQSLSAMFPSGRDPDSHWMGVHQETVSLQIEGAVQRASSLPGIYRPGVLAEGRAGTEADIRAAIGLPLAKSAAANRDPQGFEVATKAMLPDTNDPDALPTPKTLEQIGDAREQLNTLLAKDRSVGFNGATIKTALLTGQVPYGHPALRDQAAWDNSAAQLYHEDQQSTLATISRAAVAMGAPSVPKIAADAVHLGFGGSEGGQMMAGSMESTIQAIEIMRGVAQVDPIMAQGLADGAKFGLQATAAKDISIGVASDRELATTLLTPQGDSASAFAYRAVDNGFAVGKGETFTIDELTEGTGTLYSQLSVTAQREFAADFAYRLTQSGQITGKVEKADAAMRSAATEAASKAMDDVRRSQAQVFQTDIEQNADPMFGLWDADRYTMISPRLFGIKPGSKLDADQPLARFLDAGRDFGSFPYFGRAYTRPDLAFAGDVDRHAALQQTVYVPVMDRFSRGAVGFLAWDPVSGSGMEPVVSGPKFDELKAKFAANSSVFDRDPEREFRAPSPDASRPPSAHLGTLWMHDLQGNETQAERFKMLTTHEWDIHAVGDSNMNLADYIDMRARELGWAGFARPKPPEPTQ